MRAEFIKRRDLESLSGIADLQANREVQIVVKVLDVKEYIKYGDKSFNPGG